MPPAAAIFAASASAALFMRFPIFITTPDVCSMVMQPIAPGGSRCPRSCSRSSSCHRDPRACTDVQKSERWGERGAPRHAAAQHGARCRKEDEVEPSLRAASTLEPVPGCSAPRRQKPALSATSYWVLFPTVEKSQRGVVAARKRNGWLRGNAWLRGLNVVIVFNDANTHRLGGYTRPQATSRKHAL